MEIDKKLYRELRCNGCRKLICYEYIIAGRVYFKCPRCGHENEFTFKYLKTKETEIKINSEFLFNNKGGELENGRHNKS